MEEIKERGKSAPNLIDGTVFLKHTKFSYRGVHQELLSGLRIEQPVSFFSCRGSCIHTLDIESRHQLSEYFRRRNPHIYMQRQMVALQKRRQDMTAWFTLARML